MTTCKHGHQIKTSRDRTSNGTCRKCANRMSIDYQRRCRAAMAAIKEHKLEALIA